MSDFHERIKRERERLGFTQEDFASLAGKKRTAQQSYEKAGGTKPDLSYLEAIHKAGADILYITTGTRRSDNERINQVAEDPAPYHRTLSPIAELVDLYEKSSQEIRDAVIRMLSR